MSLLSSIRPSTYPITRGCSESCRSIRGNNAKKGQKSYHIRALLVLSTYDHIIITLLSCYYDINIDSSAAVRAIRVRTAGAACLLSTGIHTHIYSYTHMYGNTQIYIYGKMTKTGIDFIYGGFVFSRKLSRTMGPHKKKQKQGSR